MRRLAQVLRSRRAGGVLLAVLLAVSVGLPILLSIAGDAAGGAAGGSSVGVLSTAALGGVHRLLLPEGEMRLFLPPPDVAAERVALDRPAGTASLEPMTAAAHAVDVPLRI